MQEVIEYTAIEEITASTNVIYCFVDGHWSSGDTSAVALSQDGECIGGHLSSNESWSKRDMHHPTKYKKYNEHFPEGWVLVWVDNADYKQCKSEDGNEKYALFDLALENNRKRYGNEV